MFLTHTGSCEQSDKWFRTQDSIGTWDLDSSLFTCHQVSRSAEHVPAAAALRLEDCVGGKQRSSTGNLNRNISKNLKKTWNSCLKFLKTSRTVCDTLKKKLEIDIKFIKKQQGEGGGLAFLLKYC